MKWTLKILIFLLLLLSSLSGQETKVTIQQKKGDDYKFQQVENWSFIGCTNGGHLHLVGEVRVAVAVHTCIDSSCKERSPDELANGVHIPPGEMVAVYCTTKADDEQAEKDLGFCRNNASNPHPESQTENEKWMAELSQCLKDRREYRRQKEH